ncbi:MAG TPA: hypothetical protein VGT99_10720 [Gammaproteobacteria bacterium]|nr:hypothetical protein [Gammaproteobacteria bacterium]
MKILTQVLLATGAALLPLLPVHAGDDFDVLKSMSVADFRATGLDHLTDNQIKALDAWFADYQHGHAPCAQTAAAPAMSAQPVASAEPADEIVAHLDGSFTGWGNNTRFKLDNGQVWEQVDDSVLSIGAIKNPKVTIKKGLVSAYYLSVEGVNDSVPVRRIKP